MRWSSSSVECSTSRHHVVTPVTVLERVVLAALLKKSSTGSLNWQSKHSAKRLWRRGGMWGQGSESLWPFIACRPRASAHPPHGWWSVRSRKRTRYVLSGLLGEINFPGWTVWSSPRHREDLYRTIRMWWQGHFFPRLASWYAVSFSSVSIEVMDWLCQFQSTATFLPVATHCNKNEKAFYLAGSVTSLTQSRLTWQIHTQQAGLKPSVWRQEASEGNKFDIFAKAAARLLLSGLIYFPYRTKIKVELLRGVISA